MLLSPTDDPTEVYVAWSQYQLDDGRLLAEQVRVHICGTESTFDAAAHLTPLEARQVAAMLVRMADKIDGAGVV